MKLFVSNRLEALSRTLHEEMEAEPLFAKKIVVVPSAALKNFLLFHSVEERGIATGAYILTQAEAASRFFPALPSQLELSLRIEKVLESSGQVDVMRYLERASPVKRASLADALASLFLKYAGWKKSPSGGWQREIWDALSAQGWSTPKEPSEVIYLFHPGYLPLLQMEFYQAHAKGCLILSPCSMYWGDVLSPKQEAYLLEKIAKNARESLAEEFQKLPKILKSCGRLGQRVLSRFDERESCELYEEPQGKSELAGMQRAVLTLEECSFPKAVEIHAAPTRRREVEIVRERILALGIEPSKVLVVAPDIQEYLPHIQRVFRNYRVTGLELKTSSLLARGLEALLEVHRSGYRLESFKRLLSYSNFLAKFGLQREEAEQFIDWGIESKQLALSLAFPPEEPYVSLLEAPLLGKWIEIIEKVRGVLKDLDVLKTAAEWMQYFLTMARTFFVLQPEDDDLVEGLKLLRAIDAGPFSFASIERVLKTILASRSAAISEGGLQAVRFASIGPGCAVPSELVVVMGMSEGAFPRIDTQTSLQDTEIEGCPSESEADRWQFLELFLSARRSLILTYANRDPEDASAVEPSLLIREVFPESNIESHRFLHFDAPEPMPLFSPQRKASKAGVFEITAMKQLAKNPLAYFLKRRLGIYFEREESDSLTVPAYERAAYRREALKRGVKEVLDEAEKKGKLPPGEFGRAARRKIEEDVCDYLEALGKLGVTVSSIFSVSFHPSCVAPEEIRPGKWVFPPIQTPKGAVIGCLDDLTPEGLLFHGKDPLESWPLWIASHFVPQVEGRKLLQTKKGISLSSPFSHPEEALDRFIDYASVAEQSASPLMPHWSKAVLSGDDEAFARLVIAEPMFGDRAEEWLRLRKLFPHPKEWLENWHSYLREVFCEKL